MAAATEHVPLADTAGALGVALAELQLMHSGSTLTHDDDEDVEAPYGEGDYLDDVLERCTALGLLSERAYDQLTDALASGERSEEDALAEWAPRLRQWEENSIGVVLDLHYLQITASSFSLQTDWSLPDFEQALVAACGGGTIVQRFACDAALDEHGEQHNHGKAALHARLRRAGYELVLSPGKGVTKSGQRGQGATDVDVAVCIFDVAGAFAQAPRARTLALVAGDSDFKPALVRVLAEHGSAATAAATAAAAITATEHRRQRRRRGWRGRRRRLGLFKDRHRHVVRRRAPQRRAARAAAAGSELQRPARAAEADREEAARHRLTWFSDLVTWPHVLRGSRKLHCVRAFPRTFARDPRRRAGAYHR